MHHSYSFYIMLEILVWAKITHIFSVYFCRLNAKNAQLSTDLMDSIDAVSMGIITGAEILLCVDQEKMQQRIIFAR